MKMNRFTLLMAAFPFVLYACGSDDSGGGGGTGGKKDAGTDSGKGGTGGGTGATGGVGAVGGTGGVGGSTGGTGGGVAGAAGSGGVAGAAGGGGTAGTATGGTAGAAGSATGGNAGTSSGGTDSGVAGSSSGGSAGTSTGGTAGTDGGVSALGETCGNPYVVGTVPSLDTGDTTGAGNDYGFTTCPPSTGSNGNGSPDHVYAFTPTSTGRYVVELTTTTLDSSLYAVTDCQNIDTTCLGGADKCSSDCTETISIDTQAGSTYYVMVDGWGNTPPGQEGPYTLEIKDPPTNETCGAAIPITAVPYVHESNTIGAGNDYSLTAGICSGISSSYTGAGASDLVYAFTPTQTGSYDITVETAGFDAMLYVSTACAATLTTCVAGSETSGSTGEETVNITATAGTTYYIFVDGYSTTPTPGNGGKYKLTVAPPPPPPTNDTCATATVVGALPYTATGSTTLAASNYGFAAGTCQPANSQLGNGSNDVVYSFTPTITGSYTFTLGGFDTLLYVVTDCANINGTTCVGGVDDCSSSCDEQLSLTLNAGTTYYVIVDGWGNSTNVTGTYQLDIVKDP